MAINKVVYGNTTVMDVTDTTAEPSDVKSGKVFYDKSGNRQTGTALGGAELEVLSTPTQATANVTQGSGLLGINKNADVAEIFIKAEDYQNIIRLAETDYVDDAVADLQDQIDGLGEPFRVKQWASNTLNVEIPTCTEDIGNTSIPKMVFNITGQEAIDFQIVGMIAYEVFDAASGGNRINCWPVCQFTGMGQTELSVRWMCGGTTRKTAKRASAWVLLKHR